MNKLVFVASAVSEIQQSDIFMTVKARICEAPAANLNGARVTEAFIDEVVSNENRYVGLPLYADIRSLTNGNYRRLGHLYDSRTGEFHSTQIGSFYKFEKEEFETKVGDAKEKGCYLIGYARIAKRNKKLSNALLELFADNALKFSFELTVGEYEELDDDTILIDASESNYLEGTAIVTFPACEDAVALELVAQRADDTEGGEKEMAGIKQEEKPITAEAQPETAEVKQEPAETPATEIASEKQEEPVNAENIQAEEKPEEEPKENAECEKEKKAEQAETQTAEQENAAVVIHENDYQSHSVYAYDTETGVDVSQTVSVETSTSHVEPDAQIVEADDGVHIAEDAEGENPQIAEAGEDPTEGTSETESGSETPTETEGGSDSETEGGSSNESSDEGDASDPEDPNLPGETKKTAEQLIAELAEVVESLKKEIAELKETKVVAEEKKVTAEINPFVDSIQGTGRYSLLQKEERRTNSYSLLSMA